MGDGRAALLIQKHLRAKGARARTDDWRKRKAAGAILTSRSSIWLARRALLAVRADAEAQERLEAASRLQALVRMRQQAQRDRRPHPHRIAHQLARLSQRAHAC